MQDGPIWQRRNVGKLPKSCGGYAGYNPISEVAVTSPSPSHTPRSPPYNEVTLSTSIQENKGHCVWLPRESYTDGGCDPVSCGEDLAARS